MCLKNTFVKFFLSHLPGASVSKKNLGLGWNTVLQWSHNGRDGISNHQHHDCLFNHLFRCRSKKTSKLRVTGLCAGNSPVTGEFPAQMASNTENISIWWRHHGFDTDRTGSSSIQIQTYQGLFILLRNVRRDSCCHGPLSLTIFRQASMVDNNFDLPSPVQERHCYIFYPYTKFYN